MASYKNNARSGISDNDPTKNVLELVAESSRRTDDLRISESHRIDDIMRLHVEFSEKLSLAESKRIDALRAVDVSAVALANERAITQASVLANQVASSADALRALVSQTATVMAQQTQNLTTQFTDRLLSLEKSQYENKGKSGLVDPMLSEMVTEIRALRDAKAVSQGTVSGISSSWAILLAVIGLAALLLGLYNNFTKASTPPAQPAIIQSEK
jgi:hypothetical protein